uniref:EF-hand domain-containing protein n=1 Tax=Dicentrarchus labrax TaxID=13489 RepID=A0A8P4JZZ7_DICLA
MARMEQAIKNIVDMFVEYADDDGNLSKEALKKLFEKEIEDPDVKAKLCTGNFDKVMKRMDRNRDGDYNFKEFCCCVGFISKCCYKKKTGKGRTKLGRQTVQSLTIN